ncbi:MAG: carbon-nitrogen hydrolase family protein [Candidatus Latescibacteria bacterium]|nr:carbon-nitrogen hydrolase family protein [Candidatus Latescibacterota bacterium]
MTVRIAMAQIAVHTSQVEQNLSRIEAAIDEAAEKDADIIVLPEAADVGWLSDSTAALAQPIPGPNSDRLASKASDLGVHVVCGLIEKAGDRTYNSAVLIDDHGEILTVHRKINTARNWLKQDVYHNGMIVQVAETRLGNIGTPICADCFTNMHWITDTMAGLGAKLILSPVAWAIPPKKAVDDRTNNKQWRHSYSILSARHDIYILGVDSVGIITEGVWKDFPVYGGSVATGPGGTVIAEGVFGEEEILIVDAEID